MCAALSLMPDIEQDDGEAPKDKIPTAGIILVTTRWWYKKAVLAAYVQLGVKFPIEISMKELDSPIQMYKYIPP